MVEEPKQAEALLDAFPSVKTVVVLVDEGDEADNACGLDGRPLAPTKAPHCRPGYDHRPPEQAYGGDGRAIARLVEGRGRSLRFLRLCEAADVSDVARLAQADEGTGFVVPYLYLFFAERKPLVEALAATGRPTVYPRHLYLELGGAISVAPTSTSDQSLRSIELVLRILEGAAPARLPVQMPEGYELHIHLSNAATQRVVPSVSAMRRADLLIE